MADPESAPWRDHRPLPAAVAACASPVTWGVAAFHWDCLPAATAAMVAPPIVVTAVRPAARPLPPIAPLPIRGRHRSPVRAG